jgi:hypothetical protein
MQPLEVTKKLLAICLKIRRMWWPTIQVLMLKLLDMVEMQMVLPCGSSGRG